MSSLTWVNLEDTMPSERSQSQKGKQVLCELTHVKCRMEPGSERESKTPLASSWGGRAVPGAGFQIYKMKKP